MSFSKKTSFEGMKHRYLREIDCSRSLEELDRQYQAQKKQAGQLPCWQACLLCLVPSTNAIDIKRKVDSLSFVMCMLLSVGLPMAFLQQPLTVLTRQTSQAVHTINQTIFYMSMTCGFSSKGIFAVATNSTNKSKQGKPNVPLISLQII